MSTEALGELLQIRFGVDFATQKLTHRADFCRAENDAFNKFAPFLAPIPSLSSTSLTSFELSPFSALVLDLGLNKPGTLTALSPDAECVASPKLDIEAGLWFSARVDAPLRPCNASRRSLTPTPRVERARLCNDIFEICIRPGEILSTGLRLSAR